MRKKKLALGVLVGLALFLTLGLEHWTRQKGRHVIVGLDTADRQQAIIKTEYHPYFTRQNRITEVK